SVFRFDEAERLLTEASKSGLSWYGNPWLELADLYMRAGRFAEALSALREVPRHRVSRPAHVRDSDRNEARRSLAAFLLLMGRPDSESPTRPPCFRTGARTTAAIHSRIGASSRCSTGKLA
ncbi:MAG: tetratricopeptide repeat protein, partial [Deltaproteobacteria bacterium]|nr:tetratricopeptide repeat protein [Deltaproteobacteria bacterium]